MYDRGSPCILNALAAYSGTIVAVYMAILWNDTDVEHGGTNLHGDINI